jgi:hypothetical protein
MSSQVRKAPPIRLLLLVVALALVVGSVLWTVPRTADTLAVASQEVLSQAGISVGEVQVSGRDILVCNAEEAFLQQAITLIESIDGVRLVHGSLTCP